MPRATVAAVVLVCVLASACIPRGAPPAPPRRSPPVAMPADPPPPNHGRVVIDTPGTPARVLRITGMGSTHVYVVGASGGAGGTGTYVETMPVCITPCVADLPRGWNRLLVLSPDSRRGGAVDVDVGEQPLVVAGALGERPQLGVWSVAVGTAILGGVMLGGGLEQRERLPGDPTGRALIGVGSIVLAASLYVLIARWPRKQPSTFDQYPMSPFEP
jgi:hypothetical protein